MSRVASRQRADHEKKGAQDSARRKARLPSGRPSARQDEHADPTRNSEPDGRHYDSAAARLDGQLDARLDDRLDAQAWPRYLPDSTPAAPLPDVDAPQPTMAAEEARAQRKRLQDPPPPTRDPLPAPVVPVPATAAGALTPPPAPLPPSQAPRTDAPPALDQAPAKADGKGQEAGKDKADDKTKAAGQGGKQEAKKDAGKKGDKTPGAAGKPAAHAVGGEEVAGEAELVEADPLPPEESPALDVPLDIDVPTLAAEWSAPDALAQDALPDKPRASPAGEHTAKEGKPEEKSKAAADLAAHQAARDKALRAYADLAGAARSRQQGFLAEVSGVSNYMAHAYGMTANDITHAHDAGIQAIDAEAERQCAAIEANASHAELELETAHDAALNSVRAAAGSAFGTINANDKAASALITTNVGSLKSGHQGRFTGEKEAYEKVVKKAVEALQKWSDERATIYPTDAERPLDGAKHERYQPRVVAMAAAKIKEIEEGGKETIKAWTTTSDNSLCTVGCSYQFELDQARTTTFEAGRKAVSKALAAARKGLAEQLKQGKLNIRRLRQAALTQVRNQQRNSDSTLTSQARATLNGARRGAQGALGGMQNSARGALPGYWRSLNGFEQNLKLAAPGGAEAIAKAAQNGANPILRGLDNTTAVLRARLGENQQKLDDDQTAQQASSREQREQQIGAASAAMTRAPADLAQQAADALGRFNESANQLATSVTDAAQSCAQQPEKLFKKSFEASRGRAQGSLDATFKTGGGGKKDGKGDTGKQGNPESKGEGGPKADCSGCKKEGGDGKAAAGGESKGITDQRTEQEEKLKQYDDPKSNPEFSTPLLKLGSEVAGQVKTADVNATKALDSGFIDKVDEGAVTGALRSLTAAKGRAVDQRDYPSAARGPSLSGDMLRAMGADDESYKAAIHYLNGRTLEGAKAELDASTNWYNDQESRIEETMRALSPEQAAAIGADTELYDRIHGALDGTDAKVFEALAKSDPKKGGGAATADALRMRDKIDEAKREGDHDAVHAAEIEFTTMRGNDWNAKQLEDMDPVQRKQAEDAHRLAVAAALGKIVSEEDPAKKAALEGKSDADKQAAYTQSAVDYVTRDVVMYAGEGGGFEVKGAKPGDPNTYTIKMEGANRDMAAALLLHGKDSAEARAAKIGIEIERKGDDAKAENIDEAVYDERFMPLPATASEAEKKHHAEEVAKARELRAKTLLLASEKYAGGKAPPKDYKTDTSKSLEKEADPHVAEAQQKLIARLGEKFKDDKVGADFVAGLIKEERPSAKTASLAMQYAMYSKSGTNEELMFRYPERMTRDEIKAMREQFRADTGKDFDTEAGLYGKGTFAELSGDDRLRMERAMLGVARTEQEKAEAAAFAMQQQRRETGAVGKWLAEGSYGEAVLNTTEAGLYASMGVTAEDFTPEGMLKPEAARRAFNDKGEYTGKDRDRFMANVMTGKLAAESYQAVIDQYANLATTGIAILGAIAAAVITVATGGAAGPLIAAAVITGLASMGASYAIKGGRYGWEQAAIDLGMTAVQAVTAGVGAQLGAAAQIASKGAAAASTASRALATLAKLFTGNPVVDQIIIGAVTGSIGGLAGAAFDEKTWEKGGGDAVGALFGGLIKGALSGAATAALTNSLEALGRNGAAIADRAKAIAAQGGLLRGAVGLAGRGLGAVGKGLDKGLNASTGGGVGKSLLAMGQRGLARGVVSGLGGMAGRSTEILFDKATGKYKGRLDDALADIGQAGLHAAVQGVGEGAGEAVGQGLHNRKLASAAKAINDERVARRLEPLKGDPMDPHSPLRAAAEDLMFMNQHGRNGKDGLGQAINLDHIVTHGGLAHTVAVQQPDAVAQDAMRGELMRHVPESLHGDFADVPIRVLSEAEYKALTRSESGPVVTLIENGKPVVVIREGTPLSHLADEGPHLLQTADRSTRAKVAKLDEATLARWDELDVDTQVDLYKNKIELEIDAHQRVADALDAALARGDGDPARLALDRARNEVTLANLRTRQAEVATITPSQRAAMQSGEMPRPQYLEQPARLFSKKAKAERTFEELSRDEQILVTMLEEIAGKRSMAPRGGQVDDDMQDLPDAVKPFLRRGERMPGRGEVPRSVESHARRVARERFGEMLQAALRDPSKHNALTLASVEHMTEAQLRHVRIHGELPQGVEFHHVLTVKDFPEFAHMAEAGLALPTQVHREAGHGMDTTRPLEAGSLQDPAALTRQQGFHNDPEAQKFNRAKEREIAEGSRSKGNVDEDLVIDFEQRVKKAGMLADQAENTATRWPTPRNVAARDEARANLATARQHLAEVDARIARQAQMQKALMRHIPPELHAQFADVEIRVLSPREYAKLTRSENGPVVTLIVDGKPVVVVREGTPPSRIADEGPHLMQARHDATSERVARLDEAELKNWDHLDLDTQIDLYQTKIALEIDAHQRIHESLQAELGRAAGDPKLLKADIARNKATLRNLRERQKEVGRIGPEQRADIATGAQPKPQYLEQPPRLFSKGPAEPEAPRLVVFEPFVGPSLLSPSELQSRYPGARVIASEASHAPKAPDVADFESRGGQFVGSRFGESLPDNSVDRMHVRFPLPHEKGQEMVLDTSGMSLAEALRAAGEKQANIESVTNLGPHALRTLAPHGEMEIVFHENSIAREIERLCQKEWTDPASGKRYRLEPVGEPQRVARKDVAPHSGFGIPEDATHAHRITLRKVPVPDAEAGGSPHTPPPKTPHAAEAPVAPKTAAPVTETPRPTVKTLSAEVPQSGTVSPLSQAPRELTPGELKRVKRAETAQQEVPGLLAKLGIDTVLLVQATPDDILNIYNALDGDPLASAGGKKKPEKKPEGGQKAKGEILLRAADWEPSEHQKTVAKWALEGADGDPAQFQRRYEYARARYSALKEAEEFALKGTPDYRNVAAVNAGKTLTREFLSAEIARDEAAIKLRPDGQHLTGPTRGLTAIEVARAVQELERIDFKTAAAEAYHARKHRKEVPSTIRPEGGVIDRYFAGGMDVIRNGKPVFAEHLDPPKVGTRIVIHRRYVIDGKELVKEAIIHVAPDGKVVLLSWGDPKAVKPTP
ncbi:hypothetical protein [Methylococcus sp. EFPC2]|uniref:hypothetical protein n=1 Tax=Methylococcus sp. EFPC2 TaxID=2812648 RepID=UPI001967C532|nr:hypothetical protein [Methylococcus sp. EFPC2]QSA98409.1 hypothetical protein JWZ97_06265 [Methylococcus sp. EFPC2]